jgi:hypothetical protein
MMPELCRKWGENCEENRTMAKGEQEQQECKSQNKKVHRDRAMASQLCLDSVEGASPGVLHRTLGPTESARK